MTTAVDSDSRQLIAPHVFADAEAIRDGFATARPFGHCVIEDFFAAPYAQALLDAFPACERGNSLNEDGVRANKSVVESGSSTPRSMSIARCPRTCSRGAC